jgi:probable rRNA maturation factor
MITIETPPRLCAMQPELSNSGLTRFLNRARLAVGLDGQVEVLLADDATLRRLNKSFRGKNKSTDVLSFPTSTEIAHVHAGDLAISLETAARQAATYGHTLRDEVRILLLHGLLHLTGEDHEIDDGEMAAREAELRRELRLPNSLIERVGKSNPNAEPRRRSARPVTKIERSTRKPMKPSFLPQPAKPKRGRSI